MKIEAVIVDKKLNTEEKINKIKELFINGELSISDINEYVNGCYNPLGAAFELGDLPLIRFLISIGADINAPGNKNPESLLQIAVKKMHPHLVKFLINEIGVRIDAPMKNFTGDPLLYTALRETAYQGDIEIFNLLLENMEYSLEQIEKLRDEKLSAFKIQVLEDENKITIYSGLKRTIEFDESVLQGPRLEYRKNLETILNILNDLTVDLKKHNFSQLSEYRSAGVERFAMTLDELDIAKDLIDNVIMLYYDKNSPKCLNSQSIYQETTETNDSCNYSSSSSSSSSSGSMSPIIAQTEETLIDIVNSEDEAMNVAIILSRQAMTDEVIIQPLTLQYSSYSSSSSSSSNINSTELNLDNNTSSSSGYVLDSKAEVNETKPSKEELREIHNRKFKK